MSKKPLQAFVHAVGHPLRVRILEAFSGGTASASMLCSKLDGASLRDVNYHLGVLEECDLIERVGSSDLKGPTETFYELSDIAVDNLVREMVPLFQGLQFEPFRTLAQALFKANEGPPSVSDHTTIAVTEVLVDERGADEISKTLLEALERVESAAVDGEQRGSEGDPGLSTATVGVVLFRSGAH